MFISAISKLFYIMFKSSLARMDWVIFEGFYPVEGIFNLFVSYAFCTSFNFLY